ncbi:MAG: endonuclease III domain-containing protein [Planctomycetota bacterium]
MKPLAKYYTTLFRAFGPQRWWPADTPFEMMVGAILTQNAAWANVEKAIANLRAARVLSPRRMSALSPRRLSRLIRPAGYFNVKEIRLRAFLDFVNRECGGSVLRMFRGETGVLRGKLLAVYGIGPETADSILLYAGNRPVFVIDAYTRRIFSRHGIIRGDEDYEELRALFERNLPRSAPMWNEYHALLVRAGKDFCRKSPRCRECPLGGFPLPGVRNRGNMK